jgi:enoyl-[acyl-carrier protein] reductase III
METQFKDLEGKWALILGASSGFGGAAALRLAQAGMNICGVHLDRRATMDQVESLKTKINETKREALFFNVNAADPEQRAIILGQLSEKKISIHILFHSLAFGALKPFISEDPINQKQIEMTMDVMANSLVYWTQDVVKNKLFASGGRIYAMTSAGSSRVWKSYGAVSAAKSALESHIRQLSLELAPLKITANAICAGVTDTPALRKIPGNEVMIEMATNRNPYKRLTTPEDIANATVALSLPHMGWMTGNVLNIDGGEIISD